ncbi:hypothetical protein [Plantibacter sp. CFBP 8804]|uniref:hypothetical protein n=1 Tax=Plantibacter sp. CFBP 8804 TaxID=2775270 RepID=UPI00178126A7|nr:hypothetical protein [Plantibacter sp. CFBP 8804]MBD8518875.1 hypothetical protein [Plantibacter sp. CFBP 8804]
MAVNEESRQLEIAAEVEAAVRSLAHSTRTVVNPADSYRMLGELGATIDSLTQVCAQLATWHKGTVSGKQYTGDDDGMTQAAADQLQEAVTYLNVVSRALGQAHSASGDVRWNGGGEAAAE